MGSVLSQVDTDTGQKQNVINETNSINYNESAIANQSSSNNDQLMKDLNPVNNPINLANKNDTQSTDDDDFSFSLFGYDVRPFQWFDWRSISPWLAYSGSAAMVLGCVLPYVPQYWTIHKTQNSSGFSIMVCLALLIANITRVAFWFGKHFEIALLVQSAVMIIAQLMLLEICVRVKHGQSTVKKRTLFNSHIKYFWAWSDLLSYIEFLIIFSVIVALGTYAFKENRLFVETMGYFSLMTEAMLAMPQLIKNFRTSSVVGLSIGMVLMWLAGDSYKLAYFIWKDETFQFWLCGMMQITIDIIILVQICVFSQRKQDKKSILRMKNMVNT